MKLTDLEPQFIRYEEGIADKWHGKKLEDGSTQWGGFPVQMKRYVDTLADAQGVMFLCPLCFTKNNGSINTHQCEVTFSDRGVKNEDGVHNNLGLPVRWSVTGSCYDDLSTQPSVLVQGGCGWHGFLTDGNVSILNNGIQS